MDFSLSLSFFLRRAQGVTMYAMTSLFPYVGFMVARFRGLGNDGAGESLSLVKYRWSIAI